MFHPFHHAPPAKIGIATPETDAKLRKEYMAKGREAARQGLARDPSPIDPKSMIAGWWFEGYDGN